MSAKLHYLPLNKLDGALKTATFLDMAIQDPVNLCPEWRHDLLQ